MHEEVLRRTNSGSLVEKNDKWLNFFKLFQNNFNVAEAWLGSARSYANDYASSTPTGDIDGLFDVAGHEEQVNQGVRVLSHRSCLVLHELYQYQDNFELGHYHDLIRSIMMVDDEILFGAGDTG